MPDGAQFSTTDSNYCGVYAHNDANTPPPPNSPGGSGVLGVTVVPGGAGVFGANNGTKGVGVQGNGPDAGVSGFSDQGAGLRGNSNHANGTEGFAHDPNGTGVLAINWSTTAPTATDGSPHGCGVLGVTTVPTAAGVFGANNDSSRGVGVQGNGPEVGVSGFSDKGIGLRGNSNHGTGAEGVTNAADQSAIFGINNASGPVPSGLNRPAGAGVWGHTKVEKGSGVVGSVEPGLSQAAGVTGIGPIAGQFFGHVNVNGTLTIASGGDIVFADFSEEFDVVATGEIEPGMVMVLNQQGALQPSQQAYDKRVAGVIAGAGNYRSGLTLDKRESLEGRMPVALVGKVYCKVDAHYAPIEMGDLLTTSPTLGHAMKATDLLKAFGTVIGKALCPLEAGQGLIPILVALQ